MTTEKTNDVPLTSAEIGGFMNWRGPGAYTAHTERRLRKAIAEAVRREREACANLAEGFDGAPGEHDGTAIGHMIRARNMA